MRSCVVRYQEHIAVNASASNVFSPVENGIPVYVSETLHDTIGVDTADDLRKVEEYFRREGIVLPGK